MKTINNINDFENNYINNNLNNKKSKGINNKILLIEILKNNNYNRDLIPVKAASLYFNKYNNNKNINQDQYNKKVISIKNALDTLISNFNNQDKINKDNDLNQFKLIKNNNNYKLTSK